jgi:hypothetical protein
VKANFLPTALTGATRSWLVNLPKGYVTSWDQLCAIIIGNFQGTYERLSTAKTLKTIRHNHDESIWDYVNHFCNARNASPYIQDIKIINAFHNGVSDIKTVEEITMKKSKMVAELLAVADVCIEASKAQARLLESQGKGPSRKKDDREVNITDRGDLKDQGDCGYSGKQSSEQKKKMSFRRPNDAEKWCLGVAGRRTSLCRGRALSLGASLILHCWETEKRNTRWFLTGSERDIYSLGGLTPLQ